MANKTWRNLLLKGRNSAADQTAKKKLGRRGIYSEEQLRAYNFRFLKQL